MNKQLFPVLLIALFLAGPAMYGQNWRVYLNGNETFFIGNNLLGQYPILGYSNDEGRGLLVGGFGAGVSYSPERSGAFQIKYQLNVQRSRFYDHPIILSNENGEQLLAFIGINTHWQTAFMAVPQFQIGKYLQGGLGLGGRYRFLSFTDFGETTIRGQKTRVIVANNSLTPIGIYIPLELSYNLGRFSITTRLEPELTHFSRLDYFRGGRSTTFFLEFGYSLDD